MNTLARPIRMSSLVSIALGIVVALIVLLTLTGRKVPFMPGDRAAFISIAILGFLMCTNGLKWASSRPDFSWLSPFTIAAVLLGSLAILLAILVFVGSSLPMISGDRGALIAMTILIISKRVLALVHRFVST